MVDKLGSLLVWAMYLALCRFAAPEALPFIFWVIVAIAILWVLWRWAVDSEEPTGPVHHSPLTGKDCNGRRVFVECRQIDDKVLTTEQCQKCKVIFQTSRVKSAKP